jgi:hypothetical protein
MMKLNIKRVTFPIKSNLKDQAPQVISINQIELNLKDKRLIKQSIVPKKWNRRPPRFLMYMKGKIFLSKARQHIKVNISPTK